MSRPRWIYVPLFAVASFGCKTSRAVADGALEAPQPGAVAAAPAPAPADAAEARRAFEQGVKAFDGGRFVEAAIDFEAAWNESKDPAAAFNRGLAHERLGQLTDAERAFRDARRVAPSHRASLIGLSRVLRLEGRARDGVGVIEEALRAPGGSEDPALLSALSMALRADQRLPEAESAARRALARNKDDVEAFKALALIFLDQGKLRLAELTLASALKLNERDASAVNSLGLVYLRQGDGMKALAQFKRAVAVDPLFVPSHLNMGALALQYRDYAAAQRAFSQAALLEPSNVEAHLGQAYALDGQKGTNPQKGLEAGAAFEQALALQPDLADALCGAGWAYGADPNGRVKAREYLGRCGSKASLSKQERQALEVKLKSLDTPATPGPATAK